VDVFGTRNLYPTAPGDRAWHAKWDANARLLKAGEADPLDPGLVLRGENHTLDIRGDGTARSSGDVVRLYVGDPAGARGWQDVEITVYGMRVAEQRGAGSATGFSFQARTAAGHTSAPLRNGAGLPIQCDGKAYGLSFRANGHAVLEKELKHPYYTSQVTRNVWDGGPFPRNRWVGMKAIVYGVAGGRQARLELWRDLTDGAGGGTWEKVLEHTDAGGWGIDPAVAATCGLPYDLVITSPGPFVILRNDKVDEQWLKKLSIREIRP
jgi:hypothetical protein